jgi:hypothetical protein
VTQSYRRRLSLQFTGKYTSFIDNFTQSHTTRSF